jgi:hypothetical protein
MPYRVKASGAGGWYQGEVISDKDFNAHPFHEKFLRTGSVLKIADGESAAPRSADAQSEINDLERQRAEIDARLTVLYGMPADQNAPAAVAYDLPQPTHGTGPITASAMPSVVGGEVIQPLPALPNTGTVVPAEVLEQPATDTQEEEAGEQPAHTEEVGAAMDDDSTAGRSRRRR